MKELKLLDCTLRDGGYVNDWDFGSDNITNIFERLVSSNVEIIEIGFLDESRSFDPNRTIMPDCNGVNTIFAGMEKGDSIIVGMIDFGHCKIENILPCDECFLDGIRVIFKKHVMDDAILICPPKTEPVSKLVINWYTDFERMVKLWQGKTTLWSRSS